MCSVHNVYTMNRCALLGTELCRLATADSCTFAIARTKTIVVVNLISHKQPYRNSLHSRNKLVFKAVCLLQRCLNLLYTCQRLEAWLSCYVEFHHGNTSLNLVTAAPNLIKALYNLFRRPQLQTKSFPIPYFN